MRWWFFRVFFPSLKTLACFVFFEVTKVTPMKRPPQLHRKTRRQAACCGWNGAVGFNVAQPILSFFLARRKYGTSRGERNGGEFFLNLWWFLCVKILVGWDFHWTSNVHFQSAEGWQRWYIHLQNSWRWGALAQFSWQMLLAMLYRCFSDTPTVCVSASLKSSSSNEELLGPPSHVETWGQTGDSSSRRDTWDLLILQEDHPKGWWTSRTLTLTTWCCNLSTSINNPQEKFEIESDMISGPKLRFLPRDAFLPWLFCQWWSELELVASWLF